MGMAYFRASGLVWWQCWGSAWLKQGALSAGLKAVSFPVRLAELRSVWTGQSPVPTRAVEMRALADRSVGPTLRAIEVRSTGQPLRLCSGQALGTRPLHSNPREPEEEGLGGPADVRLLRSEQYYHSAPRSQENHYAQEGWHYSQVPQDQSGERRPLAGKSVLAPLDLGSRNVP
jgi:hypothetical protein